MSQKKNRDKVRFGPAGDTTTGPVSLSEITSVDQALLQLIGATQFPDSSSYQLPPSPVHPSPSSHQQQQREQQQQQSPPPPAIHPTFELDQTTILRDPDPKVIEKQLQLNPSRPLGNDQKIFESLRDENLELKIQIYNLQNSLGKDHQQNFKNSKVEQDLIAHFLNENKELKKKLEEIARRDKRLEEKKKSMLRNSECQTNLDSFNIDELISCRIKLKRMEQNPITTTTTTSKHVVPNKQIASNKQLSPDEKEILETLFRVDGNLTTTLDKLRAVADYH